MNTVGCLSGIIISPVVEEVAGKHGVSKKTIPVIILYFFLSI